MGRYSWYCCMGGWKGAMALQVQRIVYSLLMKLGLSLEVSNFFLVDWGQC